MSTMFYHRSSFCIEKKNIEYKFANKSRRESIVPRLVGYS